MREIEQDWSIQHGNSYLAKGVVLTCGTPFEHMQQPHHTYVLSKLSRSLIPRPHTYGGLEMIGVWKFLRAYHTHGIWPSLMIIIFMVQYNNIIIIHFIHGSLANIWLS